MFYKIFMNFVKILKLHWIVEVIVKKIQLLRYNLTSLIWHSIKQPWLYDTFLCNQTFVVLTLSIIWLWHLILRYFETPTLSYYGENKCIENMLLCWEQDVNASEHAYYRLGFYFSFASYFALEFDTLSHAYRTLLFSLVLLLTLVCVCICFCHHPCSYMHYTVLYTYLWLAEFIQFWCYSSVLYLPQLLHTIFIFISTASMWVLIRIVVCFKLYFSTLVKIQISYPQYQCEGLLGLCFELCFSTLARFNSHWKALVQV